MKDRVEQAIEHMMDELEHGPFISRVQVAALAATAFREGYGKAVAGTWEDRPDEYTKDIEAEFPTRSGNHERFALAMKMVGNRYGKYELVKLVNWLLAKANM